MSGQDQPNGTRTEARHAAKRGLANDLFTGIAISGPQIGQIEVPQIDRTAELCQSFGAPPLDRDFRGRSADAGNADERFEVSDYGVRIDCVHDASFHRAQWHTPSLPGRT